MRSPSWVEGNDALGPVAHRHATDRVDSRPGLSAGDVVERSGSAATTGDDAARIDMATSSGGPPPRCRWPAGVTTLAFPELHADRIDAETAHRAVRAGDETDIRVPARSAAAITGSRRQTCEATHHSNCVGRARAPAYASTA